MEQIKKDQRNDIEMYFEWWCDDLHSRGYIEAVKFESETFTLFEEFKAKRHKHFKTRLPKAEPFNLLRNVKYTPDYVIYWTDKAEHMLCAVMEDNELVMEYPDTPFIAHRGLFGKLYSYVDIKPPAKAARFSNQLTSFATFPLKQAICMWVYKTYINKVIPIPMSGSGKNMALFPNTFTPHRYFLTDGGKSTRKIKFRLKSVDEYLKEREQFIAQLDGRIRKIQEEKAHQGNIFNGEN